MTVFGGSSATSMIPRLRSPLAQGSRSRRRMTALVMSDAIVSGASSDFSRWATTDELSCQITESSRPDQILPTAVAI